MTTPLTLDQWLSTIYKADIRGSREAVVSQFMTALANDVALQSTASARLKELDALIAERGEQACAFSTKYRVFLQEALGA